jgi:hypothetical protein
MLWLSIVEGRKASGHVQRGEVQGVSLFYNSFL